MIPTPSQAPEAPSHPVAHAHGAPGVAPTSRLPAAPTRSCRPDPDPDPGLAFIAAACLCLALAAAAGCGDDGGGNDNANENGNGSQVCGNGVLEPGEQCDDGADNSDTEPGACRTDCRSAWCGDGVLDPAEACDGPELGDESCTTVDASGTPEPGFTGGVLRCGSDCTFDTSDCSICGNDQRETGEDCDGLDVGTATCSALTGLQQGVVTCAPDCTYDPSACHSCGNGAIEGSETCEGTDLGGVNCETLGYAYGTLRCGSDCQFDEGQCHSVCGNGVQEPGEGCDGADFGASTCTSLGMVGGQLRCTAWCTVDLSACTSCGDGLRDPNEECDGADLGGQTCASVSGSSMTGSLGCTSTCRLDTSACAPAASCGDGTLDTASGEQCDGNQLGGQSCASVSPSLYGGGTLACSTSCLYDTSGCTPADPCGNGQADPQYGEQCDGQDLDGQTCQGLGFLGGTLACQPDCSYDTTACQTPLTCGNGVRETGEACDQQDLHGATCQSIGFVDGTLACQSDCTYDTAACQTCGDSVVNGDDQCDGPDLANQTCATLDPSIYSGSGSGSNPGSGAGYYGGTLTCQSDCTYDVTSCEAAGWCGDGAMQSGEGEQCDGAEYGGLSCADFGGYDGGALSCTANCIIETTYCAVCGNARCEVGELASCAQDCPRQALALGSRHACALKSDGTMWCWGYNGHGAIGGGGLQVYAEPVQVLGPGGTGHLTNVAALAAGMEMSCAIRDDTTVWCWGVNSYGQLGDGTTTNRNTPVQVLGPGGSGHLSGATAISSGYRHTCVLRTDGTVWCWGKNNSGQLGDGTTSDSLHPVQVTGLGDVAEISAGGWSTVGFTCARKTDGSIWCWGVNSNGQLGDGTSTDHPFPLPVLTIDDASSISAGFTHTCAIRSDSSLWCWGSNSRGQLGDGTTTRHYAPIAVPGMGSVASISAGDYHTCAIRLDGTTWCWGLGEEGRLGNGGFADVLSPEQVVGLAGATVVSAGAEHTCAFLFDESLWCWGSVIEGKLGNGLEDPLSLAPVIVASGGMSGRHIAVSSSFSCAAALDDTALCWGANSQGQLGSGGATISTVPLPVAGPGGTGALGSVNVISGGGGSHACASLADGSAWCWGTNDQGELGDGTQASSSTPVRVRDSTGGGFLSNVISITVGNDVSCAARADGTVWCWGVNSYGQLGNGTTGAAHDLPVQVVGSGGSGVFTGVDTVSCGGYHCCALKSDDTIWCWGRNGQWQLGNDSNVDSAAPVQVLGQNGTGFFTGASAVECGSVHTCAVKSDGTAWCWGENQYGKLGVSTAIPESGTPVQVVLLTSVVGVSAGSSHSCAVESDGIAWCWGINTYGQLGDGTQSRRYFPAEVMGLSGVSEVSAGLSHSCALKTDGSMHCWGRNHSGELGNPDYYHQATPVSVIGF